MDERMDGWTERRTKVSKVRPLPPKIINKYFTKKRPNIKCAKIMFVMENVWILCVEIEWCG